MNKKNIRLTIELVPETSWFSNLRSNLELKDWDFLRKMTSKKANNRCEICRGRGEKWAVECHEIWDYDNAKNIQTLTRLIALCPACHEVKHMGLAHIRGRGHIAKTHLAKINNWTREETERYIERQFSIWRVRSRYEWHLNITWLQQYNIATKPRHH